MLTIPGSKVHKSDASLLAGGYLNLGPAKNMSKKPFFEKMSVLRMFLELRECKARSNSVSEGSKVTERLREDVECEGRFHISWNTRILSWRSMSRGSQCLLQTGRRR